MIIYYSGRHLVRYLGHRDEQERHWLDSHSSAGETKDQYTSKYMDPKNEWAEKGDCEPYEGRFLPHSFDILSTPYSAILILQWTECLCSPKFAHWKLIPNVMVFGDRGLWKMIGSWDRNLMHRMSILIKGTSESSLALPLYEDTGRTASEPGGRFPPGTRFASTLILVFPVSRNVWNEFFF